MIEFGMLEGETPIYAGGSATFNEATGLYQSVSDQLRAGIPVDVPSWSWADWFGTPYTAADAIGDAGAYLWGGVTKTADSALETVKDAAKAAGAALGAGIKGAGDAGGDFFGGLLKPVYPMLIMVAVIGLIAFLVLGRVGRVQG
jgi:hypothetical protein